MAKQGKKKSYDNISVSKIYETLKSKQFLQDLWWDLISDMKEKPSYKRIKGMVDALISKQIKNICAAPCDENERLRRKTVVAEMSIMAYTIDTVISQILYTKLQNEFVTIIKDMIQELKKEDDAARVAEASSFADSSNNKKENSMLDVRSEKEKSEKNAEAMSFDKNTEDFSLSEDSDIESDISVGKLSMDSVSSVHTSELSSFDDEISISSGDENFGKKKKKISYKEANALFLRGKLSEIYRLKEKNVPKPLKEFHPTKRVAKDSLDEEFTCDYVHDDSSIRKTLPPRVRKPNSKYASESIFCPIKFSPTHVDTNSSPSKTKIADPAMVTEPTKVTETTKVTGDSSPTLPPRKRGRPRKPAMDDNETQLKMSYLEDVARDIAAVKGITLMPETQLSGERSLKHSESSELYKQRRTISSQASKKSTAVTLFTNAMKESSPEM